MLEVIHLLPVLMVVIITNITTGMYNNIGKKKMNFDKTVFINGIVKAMIISTTFIGLAYCFDTVDLSSLGITPLLIIQAIILLYAGKTVDTICSIFGIKK